MRHRGLGLLAIGELAANVRVVVPDGPADARLERVDRSACVALHDLDRVDRGARRKPIPAASHGARNVRAVAARVVARLHAPRRALLALDSVVRVADARSAAVDGEEVVVLVVDARVDHEDVHAGAAEGEVGVRALGAIVGTPLDDALEVPVPAVVEHRRLARKGQPLSTVLLLRQTGFCMPSHGARGELPTSASCVLASRGERPKCSQKQSVRPWAESEPHADSQMCGSVKKSSHRSHSTSSAPTSDVVTSVPRGRSPRVFWRRTEPASGASFSGVVCVRAAERVRFIESAVAAAASDSRSRLATQVVLSSGGAQQRAMRRLVQRPVHWVRHCVPVRDHRRQLSLETRLEAGHVVRVAALAHPRLDGGARHLVGGQRQEAKQLGHADVVVAERGVVAAGGADGVYKVADGGHARGVDAQEHVVVALLEQPLRLETQARLQRQLELGDHVLLERVVGGHEGRLLVLARCLGRRRRRDGLVAQHVGEGTRARAVHRDQAHGGGGAALRIVPSQRRRRLRRELALLHCVLDVWRRASAQPQRDANLLVCHRRGRFEDLD
eukprot:6214266-Pleurochrysis_carterae.AAC.2